MRDYLNPFGDTTAICQACGAITESVTEQDLGICLDCQREREEDEDDSYNDLYEPDCDQCGGPAKDGFCRHCQA
jgi:hypothetical protein